MRQGVFLSVVELFAFVILRKLQLHDLIQSRIHLDLQHIAGIVIGLLGVITILSTVIPNGATN